MRVSAYSTRRLVALTSALLAVFVLRILCLPATAQTLRIYHIDVEQAEATLVVSPSGHTLLIDSGRNGDGDRLKAVMLEAGVSQIDHFVCTHYHDDHYGGIDELVTEFSISVVNSYDRGDKQFIPQSKRDGPRFTEYEETVGNRADQLTRGETIPLDPAMSVTCIATGGVVLGEEPPVPGIDENDMSIALLLQYGNFRYFIGGDIEHPTEGKIEDRDLVLDVDVYQTNHHGSDTSSSLEFMQDLSPSVIVISNGNHGGYKHPRQVVLDLYASLDPPPKVFQTNKYLKGGAGGNVADEFIADLESTDSDGTILIAVDKATGSYTVKYRDKSHTFQIKSRDGSSNSSIVIENLLPNPIGSDRDLEEVTLRNKSTASVSMAGWILQDESGRIWPLVSLGTIQPESSATMWRNGMPMSLNNDEHEIVLIDSSNQIRDQFHYTDSQEGILIQTGH